MAQKKKIKLNLGCGGRILKDFINVDEYWAPKGTPPKNFVKGNVLNLPFPTEYADYAIMDNVLEHIPMKDVPQVLWELKRVLKKGGRAVIMVPDFEYLAKAFLEVNSTLFEPLAYKYVAEMIYGNQVHAGELHQTPMSPGYLNFVLRMVGLPDFEMTMIPAGHPLEILNKYEGYEPENLKAVIRNNQILVDIRK